MTLKSIVIVLGCAAFPVLAANSAQALVIAAWDPEPSAGSDAAYTSGPGAPAAGVTPGVLARGPGISQPASGYVQTSSYNGTGFGTTSLNAAMTAGDYFVFSFSSTLAYDLDYLAIHYGRNQNGPANQAVMVSINDGAFQTLQLTTLGAGASQQYYGIDLTSFDWVRTAEFRLVGWNATTGQATPDRMTIRDGDDFIPGINAGVAIFGSPVPIPAALPLMGAGLAALGVVARRRRTA